MPTMDLQGEGLAGTPDEGAASGPRGPALAFVVDEEVVVRHFLSLIMQGSGVETMEFGNGDTLRAARSSRPPDIIFLDISLDVTDVQQSLEALGKRRFNGSVQLMSSRGGAVLENMRQTGEQHGLRMRPVLKKPFDTAAIQSIIREQQLGDAPAGAARMTLDEALSNDWVEFWYQPKIDLRRKRLTGAEAFARVRHPEHGILQPHCFMPGADEASLLTLSELALVSALKAQSSFARLGLSLRVAINVAVPALVKLPVQDIVRAHHPNPNDWPGIIIDVTEEQIVTEMRLANEIAQKLSRCNVRLAIDDFGSSFRQLMKLKEVPFAEMKLDRAFVTDCGTDKVNAPICKTVIDLAHSFGATAVGIGLEKAADVLALVSMGCDLGQGFLLGQPMPEERFVSLLKQRAVTRNASPNDIAPTPAGANLQAAGGMRPLADLGPLSASRPRAG